MDKGILCHEAARRLPGHLSVANVDVQARRANTRVPGGGRLHEYANLYFNGRNAMLFQLQREGQRLCIIRVDPLVLDLPGTVVSDQNAARAAVRFDAVEAGLARLDRTLVYARRWTHDDPLEQERHKGIMQAEILVPGHIASKLIMGAYASCADDKILLNRDAPDLNVVIDASRFF